MSTLAGTANFGIDSFVPAEYKQYAQILLPPNDKKFTINGTDTNHIYVMNFNRGRMREKIDPGNFELTMGILSGSAGVKNSNGLGFSNAGHTGSAVRLNGLAQWVKVIDDSSTNSSAWQSRL